MQCAEKVDLQKSDIIHYVFQAKKKNYKWTNSRTRSNPKRYESSKRK